MIHNDNDIIMMIFLWKPYFSSSNTAILSHSNYCSCLHTLCASHLSFTSESGATAMPQISRHAVLFDNFVVLHFKRMAE